ncbi:DUF1109 domain-containing protein [Paraburkholderia sp. J12]|uniref:DUF1109 domain-containing protein n=1 Tax=Paraburkholderia sp. J12 TaxID=2805432 RepID=UPI002ABD6A48|nr:DUF1109 domain-containing protein [Paraburkholderia sp. J12]
MKTDDLVDLLSTGIAPVRRVGQARRFGVALLLAGIGSTLLMVTLFGIRPDLSSAARTALFWAKLAFPLCVAIGALIAAVRLARPGARVGMGWPIIGAPVLLVWIAGLLVIATVAPEERLHVLLGHSWKSCPFNILLLSVPAFAAVFSAISGLAPTRLRLAGAVSGLLASAIGTLAYCFHCPEMSPTFWSVWYLLGMLLPAALGAILGPRLLRW